jgi:hypothetical protein
MKTLLNAFGITIALVVLVDLNSCSSDPLKGYVIFEENDDASESIGVTESYDVKLMDESLDIDTRVEPVKSDTIDFNPFSEYLSRDFFKSATTSRYYIDEIPGHIFVKVNENEYKKASIRRFVLRNEQPKTKAVDKVYYNNRVTDRKELNAAAKILNIGIGTKQIAELIIKDESTTYLSDSLIDINKINALVAKIDPADLGKYYFAHGATVSSITHRLYKEQRFTAKVDMSFITAGGETYSSKDNFKVRMDVCLELTSLQDIVKSNTTE